MTTANLSRTSSRIAGLAATLALVTLGFCGAAQARDNVSFSVGVGLPVVQLGNMNAYPVYTQPQPVYVQPAPIYAPRPVYYGQPVYVVPQPIYYGRRPHHRRDGGYYGQAPGYGYDHGHRPGYAPNYYRR